MARITIEDCLKDGYNKFGVVHLATKRVIQLRKGKSILIPTDNKEIVASLREIAAGKVRMREGASLPGDDFIGIDLLEEGLIPNHLPAEDVQAEDVPAEDVQAEDLVQDDSGNTSEILDEAYSIDSDQDEGLLEKPVDHDN